ncbi:MAG: divalent-cation tolerance protein CutA [Actinomycetota bacterium]
MSTVLVYVTAGSREEAVKIARGLVESRLVACANVLDGATSLYWWEGAVQEEREAVLIAKTAAEKVEAVIARVKELHSYTCPCVVAVPIKAGNPGFLQWIEAETR